MIKSVVLLSAGLDSTVNFFEAVRESKVVLALTFDYGQRAAVREIECAGRIAAAANVPHEVVELPFFKKWGGSSLTDPAKPVPIDERVSIDDPEVSRESARSVWVPNRNGVFLNIAAGFAEALGAERIVPGFNLEEAATFPDNSREFLEQSTRALSFSTANGVRVHCPTVGLTKPEIVRRGIALGVDFGLMWPCYFADSRWCGRCESCQRSRRALESAGLRWDIHGRGMA